MFFNSIKKLLEGAEAVTVMMVPADDGRVGITVATRMPTNANAALARPISLIGTVDELDEQFADLIGTYAGTRKSLTEQLAAATASLKEAAKPAAKSAATPAKPAVPAKPEAVSVLDLTPDNQGESDPDSDDEGGEAPTPAAPAASGAIDLTSVL